MSRFVKIPSSTNVVFNFRRNPIGDLAAFGLGYQRAARRLLEDFSGSLPDYDGYPVLFLYRHSIEVYLKAVLYRGAKLMALRDQEPPPTDHLFASHELTRVFLGVRQVFETMGWDFDFPQSPFKSLDDVEAFVREIDSVDRRADAFRFPVNTKGLANHPQHLCVDVHEFGRLADALIVCLDGAVTALSETSDSLADAMYESQQYS